MQWLARLMAQLQTNRLRKSHRPLGGWQPKAVACWTCNHVHQLPSNIREAIASAQGFFERHPAPLHLANWFEQAGFAGLMTHNADVKKAEQSLQTMTVTNLHSLASSATAGWQSAVVDNTSNLYIDAQLMIVLDFANTAPANSKAAFLFAYGGEESGTYTNPCSGSEGTLTLVDITANDQCLPQIGRIPYTTQDEVAESAPMSVRRGFGFLPSYWGVALINHSGAALAASANTVKYRGLYFTVI